MFERWASAAALIDNFKSAQVVICPVGMKSHPFEKHIFILIENSFIELPKSNLKSWEKRGTVLTLMNKPKQEKANINDV